MKRIVVIICLTLSYSAVFATDYKDSLLKVYIENYKELKTEGEIFPNTLFKAYSKSFSLKNDLTIKALEEVGSVDSASMDILDRYVLSKFLNENVLLIESEKDYTSFIPVLNLLSTTICNCVTLKNQSSDLKVEALLKLKPVIQNCMSDMMSNDSLLTKFKTLMPEHDTSYHWSQIARIHPFIHCELLKNYLYLVCGLLSSKEIHNYKK